MAIEDLFNEKTIIDLSFYNFRNAITAAYFANNELEVLKVNDNFRSFFPILGNVTNVYFPDVLEQLGIAGEQIDAFVAGIKNDGHVLIPEIQIEVEGETRVYSLLSTRTKDLAFSYLNGIQGQFVDRTQEWNLKHEKEELLEERLKDQELIAAKTQQLEQLAKRLAQYLSPQIYETIFSGKSIEEDSYSRKNLTVFFSDIVQFTDMSDSLEPEKLATVINSYLSEMTQVALDCGGTIDKFIGDAILVFFGDPKSRGEKQDALAGVDMAIKMQERIKELQGYWKKNGVTNGLNVRMGVTTGYCTVGNFGSSQRMDYTVLGKPVNLAARLESLAEAGQILISDATYALIEQQVDCKFVDEIQPKGFARAVNVYSVQEFKGAYERNSRTNLSHTLKHVEVNILDSSDIPAAIRELKLIQDEIQAHLSSSVDPIGSE
ncbi:MAG: adenylate/guanylate cyclase domain-containing protein [Acidiferrobacteraceae bacterium]|jgi:class 3 adenylate cyclase|nr:adenylate/guanylate cyclase domain-containing protein [Acidiferrobacteraceae bacterium]MBT3639822.1 adenylate/guanylate cyclase domain-containing protein [Acidiferrobacteraceae bacterium]MBT3770712.1 adenylate/guanylate cyclase domain-containing protein [Acidiferrobacteraceae bacterium]MBT3973322.1 adenylate/guanylate cyclase domain-containing protein [Acidiferrobacteraceae bacterium]MBT4395909.1 adenylate/guanylate cyclase domain-containing protein [Acidiferrobacteraceae bacterium]